MVLSKIPNPRRLLDALVHSTAMRDSNKLEILKEVVEDSVRKALPPEWEDFTTVGFSGDASIATVTVSSSASGLSAIESVDISKAREAILGNASSFAAVSEAYRAAEGAVREALSCATMERFSSVAGEPEMDVL